MMNLLKFTFNKKNFECMKFVTKFCPKKHIGV